MALTLLKAAPLAERAALVDPNVAMKPSTISSAGYGAFWNGDYCLPAGVTLRAYDGAVEGRATHSDHTYCLQLKSGVCRNGTMSAVWTRLLNNGGHSGYPNNVRFTAAGNVKTTRRIAPGDEMFASYGRGYWRSER